MDFSNLSISFGLSGAKKVGYGVQDKEKYPEQPVITISVSRNEKRNVTLFQLNRKAIELCGFQGKTFKASEELSSELILEAIGKDPETGVIGGIFVANVTNGSPEAKASAKRFTKQGSFSNAGLFETVVEHFQLDPDKEEHEILCSDAQSILGMPGLMLDAVIVVPSVEEIEEANEQLVGEEVSEEVN